MTVEELREFKTEFTLFHSELDLEKLKEQLSPSLGNPSMKIV